MPTELGGLGKRASRLIWLKIDLNAAEIITVEDYKHKKTNVNGSTHIQC